MSKSRPMPPEGQVLQMVMGGWISTAIAALSKHDVPDVLKKHGPMTAADKVETGGIDVWESEEAFRRFGDALAPIMKAIGIEAQPQIYPAHTIVTA